MPDVFSQLKKPKARRGKGLAAPPKPGDAGRNIEQDEHAPAVEVKPPRRPYRVNNYISKEVGEQLEELAFLLRRKEGRKVKLAEILERSISLLYEQEKR